MAAPDQKQYTEKPRKVLAAPYDPTAAPPQKGVCLCQMPVQPHAHVWNDRAYVLAPTDMIVFDAAFPDRLIAAMTTAEFEAVYGNVATAAGNVN